MQCLGRAEADEREQLRQQSHDQLQQLPHHFWPAEQHPQETKQQKCL